MTQLICGSFFLLLRPSSSPHGPPPTPQPRNPQRRLCFFCPAIGCQYLYLLIRNDLEQGHTTTLGPTRSWGPALDITIHSTRPNLGITLCPSIRNFLVLYLTISSRMLGWNPGLVSTPEPRLLLAFISISGCGPMVWLPHCLCLSVRYFLFNILCPFDE